MLLQIYHRRNSPVQIRRFRKALQILLSYAKLDRAFLEVYLAGEKTLQKLNRVHRGKDRVTDVLSFPVDEKPPFRQGPWHLGSIAIATSVAGRQAKRSGRDLTSQVLRLTVHGLVHLQGLDHERNEQEAESFARQEQKYLKYLSKRGLYPWDGSLQL